ncbi:amidohydrolase [Winogradskyella aquimaris]|uniref:Amidohydrolase n=1 Tax=Winogradskyella aquimaris TaxID=864074 RepID=A0ABU5ENC1_9FLAO|nr:amidohydrolase [Winogradskyella aquimaris]MDY2587950.1 amidohydrolase [Winogradskyella aquimaris]
MKISTNNSNFKNRLISLPLFLLMLYATVSTAQIKDYSELISKKADMIEQKVIDWRHDIHQNPELGNREFRTAALIAKHLESLGIEVQTEVGVTGVVGILKGDKPGPVVALRADMDALPVEEKNDLPFASKVKTTYNGNETYVMHACGHDGHVAILMGVAEILTGMKSELRGTVKFIFQPAEEGAPKGEEGGAYLMTKEGVLENPKVDVIFGLHMDALTEVGQITYKPAGIMASVNDMKITVKGIPAHGSSPWSGIDPIVISAQIINNLQTIVSRNVTLTDNAAVVTIGAINGGNRSNIIPEQVEMLGTIRTLTDEDETFVLKRIREIVEHTAKAGGATATVEMPYSMRFPVTFNDEELTEMMLPTLEKSAGKENVTLISAITGAEDFSYFAQKVPGLYFFVGAATKGADLKTVGDHHTPQFFMDDSSFKTGVKTMCNLVFDYMELKSQ